MIMVDIYFPVVDCTYSFKLDENVKVIYLIQEISEMMCKKYRSTLGKTATDFLLCTLEGKRILGNDMTLAASGVINGDCLMMV